LAKKDKKDKEINIDRFCIDNIFDMMDEIKDNIRNEKEKKKATKDEDHYVIKI